MATTVDTLLVRIEADMSDLKQSLAKVQRDVDRSSKGIASSFKNIGVAIKATVGAVVAQQAIRAGSYIVGLASDIEEMQGKSKVVFGEFRDQVVADLEAFGDAVGRSTFELEGMASSIQDTFVPMGFARGAAADLSVELTKLAVDVASFNNASDTETMAAFQSALVGNHETVRRFGVVITEVTLNQELMRMGIQKGTKAATEAQKVQARLNLITQGTSDAHGDAARTADSFANRTRALKADLNELAGELGKILLPAVTQIVEELLAGAKAAREFLQDIGVLARYGSNVDGLREQVADLREEFNALADEAGIPEDQRDMEIYGNSLVAMKQRLLRTQEAALAAAEALEAVNAPPPVETTDAGTADVPFGFEKDKTDKAIMQMLEANMHATRMLELEREMTAAVKTGDPAKVRAVQLSIDKAKSDQKLMNVTEEMLEKEYNLTRAQYAGLNVKDALALKSAALTGAMNDQTVAQSAATKAIQEYQGQVQAGLDYVLSNIRTNQELEETLKDLKAAYDAGKISMDEFLEAQDQIQQKINELDPAFKDLQDSADRAFNKIADAMTDMVMSGKLDLDTLGKLFKQTINEMIADAIRAQIIKPILSAAFGFIGSAIGGPLGNFIGGIGQSAGGSRVQPNKPRLVGERGPELIVPQAAATVMNNHDTKNALGGGGATIVNQTINVSAGVSQTVRAEMLSLLPRFKQDTMAAVVDAKRRGGSYGSAFG